MKIGVFDSGFGGLITLRAIAERLPQYDYVYLGDVAHGPYGNKTKQQIIDRTIKGVGFLFEQGCSLVVIACNSASAQALEEVRNFYSDTYPDRRIFGAVAPMLESIRGRVLGVLATQTTVDSHVYKNRCLDIHPDIHVVERAAPELATLIEEGKLEDAKRQIGEHVEVLRNEHHIDTLVLGCTHYPLLVDHIHSIDPTLWVISPDKILSKKLVEYLHSRPERVAELSADGQRSLFVTRRSSLISEKVKEWFDKAEVQEVSI